MIEFALPLIALAVVILAGAIVVGALIFKLICCIRAILK